ncbi:hypothetical protein [Porphyromonas loveana]|uniref:hypothetical protein n=1 Tax=Porphyromonas loveana TaxID=1884669 RepID=UPI0035A12B76
MENELTLLTQDYSSKVRTFGSLGYSSERIADLLGLRGAERAELILRLTTPGDPLNLEYRNGAVAGEWNIDAGLAKKAEAGDVDAVKMRSDRIRDRKVADLKREKFGL